jgi:hypothetical protein
MSGLSRRWGRPLEPQHNTERKGENTMLRAQFPFRYLTLPELGRGEADRLRGYSVAAFYRGPAAYPCSVAVRHCWCRKPKARIGATFSLVLGGVGSRAVGSPLARRSARPLQLLHLGALIAGVPATAGSTCFGLTRGTAGTKSRCGSRTFAAATTVRSSEVGGFCEPSTSPPSLYIAERVSRKRLSLGRIVPRVGR